MTWLWCFNLLVCLLCSHAGRRGYSELITSFYAVDISTHESSMRWHLGSRNGGLCAQAHA